MTIETITLADDPEVQRTRATEADLKRRLADARERMKRPTAGTMVSAPETKRERIAREESLDLEEQLAPARRARDVAERAARQRIVEAARPAEQARLAQIAERLAALIESVRVDLLAREALAARLGGLPGAYHTPALLGLGPALDQLRRQLAPPAPAAPPAPTPPGKTRVRVLQTFFDSGGAAHHPSYNGAPLPPEDLDTDDAAAAIRKGWAERVEA
jgi:hypothetical protein